MTDQLTSNERLSQIREHDFPILLEFHSKHALGPLTRPSCLVCGRVPEQWPPAIQHAELPGIVVCHPCRDRATHETLAPSSNGNNALPVGAEDDPLLEWVLERYENCIRIAAQKKGQDRDGWLEDATQFQAVLKRLAAPALETFVVPVSPHMPKRERPAKAPSKSGLRYQQELAHYCGFRWQWLNLPPSEQLETLLEQLADAKDDAIRLHHAYVDLKFPEMARSSQKALDPLDSVRWICPRCTTVNGIEDEVCVCRGRRPSQGKCEG